MGEGNENLNDFNTVYLAKKKKSITQLCPIFRHWLLSFILNLCQIINANLVISLRKLHYTITALNYIDCSVRWCWLFVHWNGVQRVLGTECSSSSFYSTSSCCWLSTQFYTENGVKSCLYLNLMWRKQDILECCWFQILIILVVVWLMLLYFLCSSILRSGRFNQS